MARATGYEAPDRRLIPSEQGAQAFTRAGRYVGEYYRQTAQDVKAAGVLQSTEIRQRGWPFDILAIEQSKLNAARGGGGGGVRRGGGSGGRFGAGAGGLGRIAGALGGGGSRALSVGNPGHDPSSGRPIRDPSTRDQAQYSRDVARMQFDGGQLPDQIAAAGQAADATQKFWQNYTGDPSQGIPTGITNVDQYGNPLAADTGQALDQYGVAPGNLTEAPPDVNAAFDYANSVAQDMTASDINDATSAYSGGAGF